MNPLLSTALMGLFAFSGTTASMANTGTPVVQPVEASTTATYTVDMTAYNAVPEQTKADPTYTASGAYSNPDVVAARSRDLADELPFGTVISISGPATQDPRCGYNLVAGQIGYRVIADTMNERMHNKIDILLNQDNTVDVAGQPMNPSKALGLCEDVKVAVVGHIDISNMPKNQEELAQDMAGTTYLAMR